MQFKDLRWHEWHGNSEWECSQPILFRGHTCRVFRRKRDLNDFAVDVVGRRRKSGKEYYGETLYEQRGLVELCAGVLPFCEPLPEEVKHDGKVDAV